MIRVADNLLIGQVLLLAVCFFEYPFVFDLHQEFIFWKFLFFGVDLFQELGTWRHFSREPRRLASRLQSSRWILKVRSFNSFNGFLVLGLEWTAVQIQADKNFVVN